MTSCLYIMTLKKLNIIKLAHECQNKVLLGGVTRQLARGVSTHTYPPLYKSGIVRQSLCWKSIHLPQRTASASFMKGYIKKKLDEIPKYDKVKGDLVYVGTIASSVKFVKTFSLSTSIIGVMLQPFIYKELGNLPAALKFACGGMVSFFILLTPLMLHIITKRYITQMYYNAGSDTFTATTYSFFVTPVETVFQARDIRVPELPGMLTTVKVHGKPLFLDPSLFLDRRAYVRLMKYDQPMDWEYHPHEDKDEKK